MHQYVRFPGLKTELKGFFLFIIVKYNTILKL